MGFPNKSRHFQVYIIMYISLQTFILYIYINLPSRSKRSTFEHGTHPRYIHPNIHKLFFLSLSLSRETRAPTLPKQEKKVHPKSIASLANCIYKCTHSHVSIIYVCTYTDLSASSGALSLARMCVIYHIARGRVGRNWRAHTLHTQTGTTREERERHNCHRRARGVVSRRACEHLGKKKDRQRSFHRSERTRAKGKVYNSAHTGMSCW